MVDSKHPIQPLEMDSKNILRFKANNIVRYLLDNGGIDMNRIAMQNFSREDHEQFIQLIGYSHSGAGDLSYFSDEVWYTAQRMYQTGECELQARVNYLEEKLSSLKNLLREPVAELYGIHPEDLQD